MSNNFSKEEVVAFEQLLEGFQDALVLSRNVSIYRADQTTLERASNIIWRPQPYIMTSHDGTDATSYFLDKTQLSVPTRLGYSKFSAWTMTATELRDALQEQRLGSSARDKLASDINVSVNNVAALQGTLVVKRGTATGYDDAAQIDSLMNEQGVNGGDRYWALSSRDYNNMAKDLANRYNMTPGKVQTAYERNAVGMISGLDTYKMDYPVRLAAAAGGGALTIDTQASASNYYVPVATSTASTGEVSNVDNRYQTITVSATTNVAAGDCFAVAGINAVHHITKTDTGQLKTYRVISVDSGTTMTISPPIISNQGESEAEAMYKNCVVTESASAAIVFLNTVAAAVNPFWHKDAIQLMPGRYAVPADAGVAVIRASTDQGIELVMQKFYDINTMKVKYRVDTLYGVTMVQPEMAGIALFNQT